MDSAGTKQWSEIAQSVPLDEDIPRALNVPLSRRKIWQERAMNLTPSAQTQFMCDLAETKRHYWCMSSFVA